MSKILFKNKNTSLFAFSKGKNLSEHPAPFDTKALNLDSERTIIIDAKACSFNQKTIDSYANKSDMKCFDP
ncbi:MAG: hypothetical protein AAGC64_13245 [Bacteroidota bacterium]